MRRLLGVALATLAAAALVGCSERTYVVVSVSADPALQPAATQIRIVGRLMLGGVALVESEGLYPETAGPPLTFPSSYIVVADGRGNEGETLQVVVELRDSAGATIGRARGEVAILPGRQSTLEAMVRAPCATVDDCLGGGTFCARPQQCVCESAGSCLEGVCEPLPLDDSNECTTDGCDEASRSVTHAAVADGAACQPLGGSTLSLVCVGGMCACGDGVTNAAADEQCDDGPDNANAPNRCRADPPCKLPRCGDGIPDDAAPYNEECDEGAGNCDDPDCTCRTDCKLARCGDSIEDATSPRAEQCDWGAANSDTEPLTCRGDCRQPYCGDRIKDRGIAFNHSYEEECDDGADNSWAPNACRPDTCKLPYCGDGVTDNGPAFGEECDDGDANADAPNACRPLSCRLPRCGDGIPDDAPPYNEECDQGYYNAAAADACRPNCKLPACGDGIPDSGEECDDPTGNSDTIPDKCRTNCRKAHCGDGVVDTGERCDPAHPTNGPGCNVTCTLRGVVSLVAGQPGGAGNIDGTGTGARLRDTFGAIAVGGSFYLTADEAHGDEDHTIRRFTPADASVTTIAGLAGVAGSDPGIGSAARFSAPRGLSAAGNLLFVADYQNHLIRQIDLASADVTTFAGIGTPGSVDGSVGTASLAWPLHVVARSATELYVMEGASPTDAFHGCRLRRIDLNGTPQVVTLAGDGTCRSNFADGVGTAAAFSQPGGMVLAPDGNSLYLTDFSTIRQVDLTQDPVVVTTVAGSYGEDCVDDPSGPNAWFGQLAGIAVSGGALYVADAYCSGIRRFDLLTTAVTTPLGAFWSPGTSDSPPRFSTPFALAADGTKLLVAERDNHLLRMADLTSWTVTPVAGLAGHAGAADGALLDAQFSWPNALAIRGDTLYVADQANAAIRVVDLLAGSTGVSTLFDLPDTRIAFGVAVASDGRLFGIFDQRQLMEVDPASGALVGITAGGALTLGTAGNPRGAVVAGGALYVADRDLNVVRRVDLTAGAVTIFAGKPGEIGFADGLPGTALLSNPEGITACRGGLYVSESETPGAPVSAHIIRRIDLSTREISTVAGGAGVPGYLDEVGRLARFRMPSGLACDEQSLFVADSENHVLRQIVLDTSVVTTLAGALNSVGSIDGTVPAARFNYPQGLVFDPTTGDLLVTDRGENVVRRVH